MKEVILRMNEQEKYEAIKLVADGKLLKKRCSIKLNISLRHVNRLVNKYKREGKAAFIHGNRSRKPINKLSVDFSNKILHLAKTKYYEDNNYLICNIKHFKTLLARNENININYVTLRNLLLSNSLLSPRIHRITRRKIKREEILKHRKITDLKTIEKQVDHLLSLEDAHPRMEKAKYFGELIQMDACSQFWNDNLFLHLHLAIDNSTGIPVGGYFDYQETLNGYYHVFKQILVKYGVPAKFLTDKRTVFIYESLYKKSDENDTLTQFAYACKNLGIDLATTSVAQSKGQVERYNGIFQDRLKAELRLNKITSISKANDYLINIFIPNYIEEFKLSYRKSQSVFETIDLDKIDYYLSRISRRLVDKGCCISFKNEYYGFFDLNNRRICPPYRAKCTVIESFKGELFANVFDKTYLLKRIKKNKIFSKSFDDIEEKKVEKPYIPPMDHPWRYSNFDSFQQYFKGYKYAAHLCLN